MIRVLLAAFAVVSLALPAVVSASGAQQPVPSAKPVATKPAQPPVWVIKDADTEITLFATVHALPGGIDWLSADAAQRFDAAGQLIIETKLPDDRFALGPIIQQLGIDADMPPARERLPAATFAALSDAAADLGIPIAALDRMKPWLISITMGEAVLTRAGVSSGAGVEVALLARAKRQGKPLAALETPQQQLGFFAGLPVDDQVAMLDSTLADIPDAAAQVATMVALWQKGDVDRIASDFASEARASPVLHEVLLAGRNRAWVDFLASEMARPGRSFLAVGAGHFGGPDGLLALLKAKGLTVERLPGPVVVQAPAPPKVRAVRRKRR